jgi:hypothetical protein
MERRTALKLIALGAVTTTCGTSKRLLSATGETLVTCPDPTLGSVTGETGSISGVTLDFVDAAAIKEGVAFQWQWYPLLSTKPNAGAHYRAAQTVQNEKWLLLILVGGHEDVSNTTDVPPPSLGTYTINTPWHEGTSGQPDYRVYKVVPNYISHSSNCKQTSKSPTSGSITYTQFDTVAIAGSYDLYFGTDHITGTFTAPQLEICDPRPSKTCIAG